MNKVARKAAKPQSYFYYFLGDLASLRESAFLFTALVMLFSSLSVNVLCAQGYPAV